MGAARLNGWQISISAHPKSGLSPSEVVLHNRGRTSRGFTLIELLVVVAIISLLVSILLPTLARAKDLAKIAICAGNERGIVLAVHLYANDHHGALPNHSTYWPSATSMFAWEGGDDLSAVYRGGYVDDYHLLFCPDGPWPDPDAHWGTHSDSTFFHYWNNYGWYMMTGYDIYANVKKYPGVYENVPSRLEDPSSWVLITDLCAWKDGQYCHQAHLGWQGNVSFSQVERFGTNVGTLNGTIAWRPEETTIRQYPLFDVPGWWSRF